MKPIGALCVLTLILSPALQAAPGPVALWRGDGDANDSAGTYHGMLVNGTGFVSAIAPGSGGQAFDFDGIDDEVRVPSPAVSDFATGLTVAGWLRTSGTADFSGLLDKFVQGAQTTGFQLGFSGTSPFPPNQPGILRGDLGVGPTYVTAFNLTRVDDGQAHHFALTCDRQQILLYVDGVPGAPTPATGWLADNAEDLVLGRDNAIEGRNFRGQLDEVGVYDRALAPGEIQALAGQVHLDIQPAGPGVATVSWPALASGFRLQSNATLDPAAWGDEPTGTNTPVSVAVGASARFYRLTKP
jgi:hypothetical protein